MSTIEVKLGETLDRVLTIYADDEGTLPLNLTGWTTEVELAPFDLGENPAVTLTQVVGLTKPAVNQLRMTTLVDPNVFAVGLGSWFLRLVSPEGEVYFPDGGKLVVGAP